MTERDFLIRGRRRSKLDRVLRSMRGIHIVGAERQREAALQRVMEEYDSGNDLSEEYLQFLQNRLLSYMHPTLNDQQQKFQQKQLASASVTSVGTARSQSMELSGAGGAGYSPPPPVGSERDAIGGDPKGREKGFEGGSRHAVDWAGAGQQQQQQQQQQQPLQNSNGRRDDHGRGVSYESSGAASYGGGYASASPPHKEQGGNRDGRDAGSARTSYASGGRGTGDVRTSIDVDVLKYKVEPVAPEEEPFLPRRSKVRKGEMVDDWHVLQEMHRQAGEEGEKLHIQHQREKQRGYMEELKRQEAERRQREEEGRAQKVTDRAWVDAKVDEDRRREEMEKKEKSRRQAALHSMYCQQEVDVAGRKARERRGREAEEDAILARMRREIDDAKAREEEKKRQNRIRAEVQKMSVKEQVEHQLRAQEEQRLEDLEYGRRYEALLVAEDERRKDVERKRAERIGKLEIMSNDNAEREKRLRMEEDRRFLDQLGREEARKERIERDAKERVEREKSQYASQLTAIMQHKKEEARRSREATVVEGERQLRELRDAALRDKELASRAKHEHQSAYKEELRRQMAEKDEQGMSRYRMSDKERALNLSSFASYVEQHRNPHYASSTPIIPDKHNFAYEESFLHTLSASGAGGTPKYSPPPVRGSGGMYKGNQQAYHSPGQQAYHSPGQSAYHSPGQPQHYHSSRQQYHLPDQRDSREGWSMQRTPQHDSSLSSRSNNAHDSKRSPLGASAERNLFI